MSEIKKRIYLRSNYEPNIVYHHASTTSAYKNGDLKTEKMWLKEGYKVKPGAKSYRMWSNPYCNGLFDYYFKEDVEKM